MGLHRCCIYRWLNKYDAGGFAALNSSKAKGPQTKITEKQRQQLAKLLLKNPTQLSFEFALWKIQMIAELCTKKEKEDQAKTLSFFFRETEKRCPFFLFIAVALMG